MTPSVFVFNPFAEGYIARGKAFTPVKRQAMLAEDLANLPQFLCGPGDIVLLAKRPADAFLDSLKQAGFPLPQFVELRQGRIDPAESLFQRKLGRLRPWAWGPDSVELLEPLFARVTGEGPTANHYFNDSLAQLYSKAWSAGFLRKLLARFREEHWLCSEQEIGMAADCLEDALKAIAAIRRRGQHRVVVKEALGVAGHNSLRLWEPELLPAQWRWLEHTLRNGQPLVVEPWLERELDFSVQLEMGARRLKVCGYTGLINDRKGQFLANWAEADCSRCLPAKVGALLHAQADISSHLQRLYEGIFSLLEVELQRVGFVGPVSIDSFVYRTPEGEFRLKPVVEINPRYTMGRLTVELMKYTGSAARGLFRLVSRAQARTEGFTGFSSYGRSLGQRFPLVLEGKPPQIRQGALCLNDPGPAQVCLATFEAAPTLNLPAPLLRS